MNELLFAAAMPFKRKGTDIIKETEFVMVLSMDLGWFKPDTARDFVSSAMEKVNIAKSVEGTVTVKSTAFSFKDAPSLEVQSKNVMGVVVPKIESSSVKKHITGRGYGIIGTSSRIDEAVDAYEVLVEKIILAAEIETTIKKLLDEIEKTKRRVNALEFKVIPELTEARDFIMLRLDEMERENTFRLKRIKA